MIWVYMEGRSECNAACLDIGESLYTFTWLDKIIFEIYKADFL